MTRGSRLIVRILSAALLIGQVGAAAHSYSHLPDDQQGLPEASQGCRTCHSFAPLLGAIGGSQSALPVAPCGSEIAVPAVDAAIALDPHYPAFRSRAPPAIL
ncbi:MAG: hypothetical protein ACT4UQ_03760 [Gammaproteobacteria bacterium]